jgi:hypothetical protein
MDEINIFPQEIKDGVSEAVKQTSIAFCTEAQSVARPSNIVIPDKAVAGYMDDDLHYIQSILVSTTWNKNDDIFDKGEVWRARKSPEDKPINLNHDEDQLIGHIVARYMMDSDGNFLPDDMEEHEVPDFYHILTGAVLYKAWEKEEKRERTAALLEKINAGEKYVSMECHFRGFDYGILKSDHRCEIIPRGEATAFLTKYLRAYGGTGIYKGYRVGRVLRNINFTAKGIVDNPANPDSIIFTQKELKTLAHIETFEGKNTEFCVLSNSDLLNGEHFTMADTDKINDLSLKLADAVKANLELQDKLAKADTEALTKQVADRDEQIAKLVKANDELKSQIETSNKSSESLQASLNKITEQLKEVGEAKASLETKLAEIETAKVLASRKAKFVAKGFKEEDADAAVKNLTNLSDEQFETVVAFINVKAVEVTPSTDTTIIDTAKAEEVPALTVPQDEDAGKQTLEKARADFASWATDFLGTKVEKK